ncbi:MAG: hypothetical protein D6769_02705 [Methanobacteriota archaeon]|nr:MAG: hypothetical protein D6769_02705 [Euryarchaeota archaeon]
MTFFAPLTYGFSTTKIAALKAKLLSRSFYDEAIGTRSSDSIISLLSRTEYGPYLTRLSTHLSGTALVSAATQQRFSHLLRLLRKYLPKKDWHLYDAFSLRYEASNAKLVFSSWLKGKTFSDIANKIMPALYSEGRWESIYNSSNPLKVFSTLPLGKKLKERFRHREVDVGNFIEFSEALDDAVLEEQKLLKKSRTYEFLVKEIDIGNVLHIREGGDKRKLSREGRHPLSLLKSMDKNSSSFKRLLSYYNIEEGDSVPLAHMKAERAVYSRLASAFYTSVFSPDRVFMFFLLLEEEEKNLRKLVLSKELSLSREETAKVVMA